MTDKNCISRLRDSLLHRAVLPLMGSAAALAVAQSPAVAAPPSPERPVAGRAASSAPDCPSGLFCGHIAWCLRKLGWPVIPESPLRMKADDPVLKWDGLVVKGEGPGLEWVRPEMKSKEGQEPAILSCDLSTISPQGLYR